MFRKFARADALGFAAFEDGGTGGLTRIAESAPETARSYYLDGSRRLNVKDILERAASVYAISADPKHYIYEAIRANTTNVANENNDAFHQFELLRFDPRIALPVYETYISKPHHINHKTDNPKAARGVILDSHYNSDSPALEHCPTCNLRTADRQHRDETGIHCRRCGCVVRDEFVEILVGIDAHKDPLFARGVKNGHLKAGSMGCNCLNTLCNVCGHVAYSKPEFCEHIRAGNKGTLWRREGRFWTKTNAHEIERALKKFGFKFVANDFCYVKVDDKDFEVRRASEFCQNVIFDEYSRVDQPADPKALQREILRAASVTVPDNLVPSPEQLRMESEMLLRAALHHDPLTHARAASKRTAEHFFVVRVNGDPLDTYAGLSLDEALEVAAPDEGDALEYLEVDAPDPQVATTMFDPLKAQPVQPSKDADVRVAPPPGETVVIEPPAGGDPNQPMPPGGPQGPAGPGGPGAPASPMDIDQFTDRTVGPDSLPEQEEPLSLGEMGLRPPGADAPPEQRRSHTMRFAKAYRGLSVEVSEQGNARVLSASKQPLLVVRGKETSKEGRHAFGKKVLAHVFEHGLFQTKKALKGIFADRTATSVVEGGEDNWEGFEDKSMYDSVLDPGDDNSMKDFDRAKTAPESTRDHANEIDSMDGDVRGTPPTNVLESPIRNFDADEVSADGLSILDDGEDTMREPRKTPPSSVLDDEIHTHTERLAQLAQVGKRIAHRSRPTEPWIVSAVHGGESGIASAIIERKTAEKTERRRLTQKDLVAFWQVMDKPAAAPRAAARAPRPEPRRIMHASTEPAPAPRPRAEPRVERVAAAPAPEPVPRDEERVRKLIQTRIAKAKAEFEADKALFAQGTIESFARAMRIVAKRFEVDLEPAPLKLAAEAVLGQPRAIGADPTTGQQIAFHGLAPELTRYLVAQLYQVGHGDHLEAMIARAKDLMDKGDEYLLAAESDTRHFQASLPPVSASHYASPISEAERQAVDLRRQAMRGNMELSPLPPPEDGGLPPVGLSSIPGANNGFDKRSAISSALGGTLVDSTLSRLRPS